MSHHEKSGLYLKSRKYSELLRQNAVYLIFFHKNSERRIFAAMSAGNVAYYTLGCKLNFSETSGISKIFSEKGFNKVGFEETADIYVINTCSVTDFADTKCRRIVRQALKQSPGAYIIVTGCYAQLKPEEIAKIPGVDLVLGASEKFRVFEFIEAFTKRGCARIESGNIKKADHFFATYSLGDRTRSFLKVQDGCDYFCSFCTIPLARGKSRSDTIKNTVLSAIEAASKGIKEIVLTGVNIGDFGQNTGETFHDLILALDQLTDIERFRISSIEPNLLTDEIISIVSKSKRFVPHFHIPLQSGSDKILSSMRRKYDSAFYRARIERIKTLIPDCCIGVDVITGFPSETEEDFLTTYRFLNEMDISYLHVFTYSERDNTSALKISGTIHPEERSRRTQMLRILSEKKHRFFNEQFIGTTRKVLFETAHENGLIKGYTENYIKVKIPFDPMLINSIVEVKLETIDSDDEVSGTVTHQMDLSLQKII